MRFIKDNGEFPIVFYDAVESCYKKDLYNQISYILYTVLLILIYGRI